MEQGFVTSVANHRKSSCGPLSRPILDALGQNTLLYGILNLGPKCTSFKSPEDADNQNHVQERGFSDTVQSEIQHFF